MRLSRLHGLQHTEVRARSRARIGALPSGARVRPTASGDHRATAAQPSNLVSRASGFGDRIRPGDVREASQLGAAEGKAAHRLVAARLPCVDLAAWEACVGLALRPRSTGPWRRPCTSCALLPCRAATTPTAEHADERQRSGSDEVHRLGNSTEVLGRTDVHRGRWPGGRGGASARRAHGRHRRTARRSSHLAAEVHRPPADFGRAQRIARGAGEVMFGLLGVKGCRGDNPSRRSGRATAVT